MSLTAPEHISAAVSRGAYVQRARVFDRDTCYFSLCLNTNENN